MDYADPEAARRYLIYSAPELRACAIGVLCACLSLCLLLLILGPFFRQQPRLRLAAAGLTAYAVLLGFASPFFLTAGRLWVFDPFTFTMLQIPLIVHSLIRCRTTLRLAWGTALVLTLTTLVVTAGAWIVYGTTSDLALQWISPGA